MNSLTTSRNGMPKPLIPLADYLNNHPGMWRDAQLQRDLLSRPEAAEYSPPETASMLRLFTEALMFTENILCLHADMVVAVSRDVDYMDFEAGINARSNNKSPGITRFSANMLKQMSGKTKHVMFELLSIISGNTSGYHSIGRTNG
jgi:hypothetical protein